MMPAVMGRRRIAIAGALVAVAGGAVACGSQGISQEISSQPQNIQHGAQLFSERCSGCHSLDVVGAQGTTLNVRERERVDGPNFNVRPEGRDNVLYAIRNGGYSGAIMPENIVVGKDADDVAAFLAKYSGREAASGFGGQQQTG
jgi:mono/diheme cytochrome c family protein